MEEILKRQLILNWKDNNDQDGQTTIANINPAISDTSILRTAATQLNDLTNNNLISIHLVITQDITSED